MTPLDFQRILNCFSQILWLQFRLVLEFFVVHDYLPLQLYFPQLEKSCNRGGIPLLLITPIANTSNLVLQGYANFSTKLRWCWLRRGWGKMPRCFSHHEILNSVVWGSGSKYKIFSPWWSWSHAEIVDHGFLIQTPLPYWPHRLKVRKGGYFSNFLIYICSPSLPFLQAKGKRPEK